MNPSSFWKWSNSGYAGTQVDADPAEDPPSDLKIRSVTRVDGQSTMTSTTRWWRKLLRAHDLQLTGGSRKARVADSDYKADKDHR